MLKKLNNLINGNNEPDINLAEDMRRKNRNFVISFVVISFILFNLIMYFLVKV
ncbi:MAG TPA: hypothetical protein PL041_12805 [Melioribacteraceae bacterium]|nr:hypothetical protein [Melioribacteraceae bacterium]